MQCPRPTGTVAGRNWFIAGFACNGKRCENVSILCVEIEGVSATRCGASGPVSEEQGGRLIFPEGKLALTMHCKGRYCDRKTFQTGDLQADD